MSAFAKFFVSDETRSLTHANHITPAESTSSDETQEIHCVSTRDFWLIGLLMKRCRVLVRNYQETLKTVIQKEVQSLASCLNQDFIIDDRAEPYQEFSEHGLIEAVLKFNSCGRFEDGRSKSNLEIDLLSGKRATIGLNCEVKAALLL